MFEESRYIGPSVPKKDSYGLHVPSMPKQPVLLSFYQYGPNTVLTLHPDAHNTLEHTRDDRTLRVKVLRPLKVGYGKKVQTVLVEVEDGRADLLREKLVLRCFDTLYVSPDLLELRENLRRVRKEKWEKMGKVAKLWIPQPQSMENTVLHQSQKQVFYNKYNSKALLSTCFVTYQDESELKALTYTFENIKIADARDPSFLLPNVSDKMASHIGSQLQEYDEYQIDPDDDAPHCVLQPRRHFCDTLFENERAAYEVMSANHCAVVPDYKGSYSLCHDRAEENWVKVLVLKFVKGKCLADIINELLQTPNPDEETANKVSDIMETAYISLDQIHQAHVTHTHCEPHKCIIRENGEFCWIDFTRARRDCEEDSDIVEMRRDSDIGRINNIIQRLCHDLNISYKFEGEGIPRIVRSSYSIDSSDNE